MRRIRYMPKHKCTNTLYTMESILSWCLLCVQFSRAMFWKIQCFLSLNYYRKNRLGTGFLSFCYFLTIALAEGKQRAIVECQYEMAILPEGSSKRGRLKNCPSFSLSFGKRTQNLLKSNTAILGNISQGSPVDKVIMKLKDLSHSGRHWPFVIERKLLV